MTKGILKLKNSQVEASLGDYGVVHPRSTRVRLVIMGILIDEIHKDIIIQNISEPIACSKYDVIGPAVTSSELI